MRRTLAWGLCVGWLIAANAAAQDEDKLLDRSSDASFWVRPVSGWTAVDDVLTRDVLVHEQPFCSLNVGVHPPPPTAMTIEILHELLVTSVEKGVVDPETLVWLETSQQAFDGVLAAQVAYTGTPMRDPRVQMHFVQCIVLTKRHTLVLTISTAEAFWEDAEEPVAALLAAIELVEPLAPGDGPPALDVRPMPVPPPPARPPRGVKPLESISLPWLARHQEANGSFSVTGWTERCHEDGCAPEAAAGRLQNAGLTGLAALVFMGNGHTHKFGPHKRLVRRALGFLVERQQADGCLAADGENLQEHCQVLWAIAEAFFLSDDFKLERPIEKGIAWLQAAIDARGWASLTAEQTCALVMPLKVAALNGVPVGETLTEANAHLRSLQPTDLAARSACLLGRILSGEERTAEGLPELAASIAEGLQAARPEAGEDFYRAVFALFQAGDAAWLVAQERIAELRAERLEEGCAAGSFPGPTAAGQLEDSLWLLLAEEIDLRFQRIQDR